jgi:two-component system, cell cycle response regulator
MPKHDTTRTVLFAEVQAAISEACLVLIYGANDLGKRFELTKDITIGRDPSNDIVVETPDVSRQHARVERREHGEWWLTDLASRNGTRRNGETLKGTVTLANGDLISVGGVIFKYIAGGNVEALFHEEIYRMTIYDGLTKVANKRYLIEFLDREIARALRYGSPLSLAMLDIDLFKNINDDHGHPAGDMVLETLSAVMRRLVRDEQLLARYGGEEFSIVMPEIDARELRAFCESIREAVASTTFEFREERIPVTISIGAATFEPSMTRDQLIQRADEQLYRAKRAGRNVVAIAGEG